MPNSVCCSGIFLQERGNSEYPSRQKWRSKPGRHRTNRAIRMESSSLPFAHLAGQAQPQAGYLLSQRRPAGDSDDDEVEQNGKKQKTKRKKVNHACLYCRRSHMTCDEGRPCQRWYALNICFGPYVARQYSLVCPILPPNCSRPNLRSWPQTQSSTQSPH